MRSGWVQNRDESGSMRSETSVVEQGVESGSGRGLEPEPPPVPSVVCLLPLQLILAGGTAVRGVLVRVSLDQATIRVSSQVSARLSVGDVLVIAGFFDGFLVKAAAVVKAVVKGAIEIRFAAMSPEARAHLTRFVYGRLPRPSEPRRPPKIRSIAFVEPSRRKVFSWVPRLRETDRHLNPSERWLDRLIIDPGQIIAPRN